MGINFDGINPESKAKLEQIVSDGKVSQAEYNSLTPAEKEALEKGLAGQIGDDTLDRFKFGSDAPEAKGKEKDWKEVVGGAALITGSMTVVGGLIGGVAGLFAGGVGAVPGAIAGAKMGAIAGAVISSASMLTSCGDDGFLDEPDIKIEDNSKYETNVSVTINVTANNSNEEIVSAVNDLKQTIADYAAKQEEYNKAILQELLKQGVSLDRIVEMLDKLGVDMSTVIELIGGLTNIAQETKDKLDDILYEVQQGNNIGVENNKVLNAILAELNSINGNDADIKALLNAIIAKIDKNNDMTARQSSILVAIMHKLNSIDKNISSKLLAILDKIDTMGTNNYDLLVKILNSIEEGKTDNNKLLESILNAVLEGNEQNKDMDAKTHQLLTDILNSIGNFENSMKDAFAAAIAQIGDLSSMTAKNRALLEAILKAVHEGNEQNKDMDAKTHQLLVDILNSIGNFENSMKDALTAIVAKMDQLSAENKAFLQAILDKMDEMDKGNQDNFATIIKYLAQGNNINAAGVKVLTEILNKLDKMDASTQANFKAVINLLMKGNNINAEILNKLEQVLAKIDKMDANQANFFAQVLAKFDKLDAGQQANVEKILDAIAKNTTAINKNTKVAEATYELVAKLLNKIDELKNNSNVNVSEILDAIAKISVGGGNVDLSTIEKLLADLLKSSEMNNKVLTDIEAKLDAVAVTIGGIKVALGEGHEKILAKLDEILKKIPNGCHCDVTVIIEKLDELIESIKKNPDDDNKHEGILDDLEDLFN